MKKYTEKSWEDSENFLLRDYYYVLSKEELYKILPGRKLPEIIKQVAYLTKCNWKFKNR